MKYILGLDVGGTKTDCLIADETGTICGYGNAGSGSYEYNGVESAYLENERAIQAALDAASIQLSDIACVGMGVAGADIDDDYRMLEEQIYTPLLGDTPRVFLNDAFAALRGGAQASYGLVIACGTGAIAAGIAPNGTKARAGGWMPEYGDKCTGETLGLEGLNSVWRAREGIIPPTRLTDLFLERSGCADVDSFFHAVYTGTLPTAILHPMAQLVFQAGLEGDPTACDILRAGGEYLGQMLNAVARKLSMTNEAFGISMAGSVFSEGAPVLAKAMKSTVLAVCPSVHFHQPMWAPIVGALLLGFEKDEPIKEQVYTTLSNSLLEAESTYNKQFKQR
jgi:N-acetylglucosamine kinase-like BadF-type ATPase